MKGMERQFGSEEKGQRDFEKDILISFLFDKTLTPAKVIQFVNFAHFTDSYVIWDESNHIYAAKDASIFCHTSNQSCQSWLCPRLLYRNDVMSFESVHQDHVCLPFPCLT